MLVFHEHTEKQEEQIGIPLKDRERLINEIPAFRVVNGVLTTNYFIGVDWLDPDGNEAFRVIPKREDDDCEIDYLRMLMDALHDPYNLSEHLDGLFTLFFSDRLIEVPRSEDGLTIFVVVQFLSLLKNIVRRGLRKSFRFEKALFEFKVKGRILPSESVKMLSPLGPLRHKFVCSFQELDVDSYENQILKKAFLVSKKLLREYSFSGEYSNLIDSCRFIGTAFEAVHDIDFIDPRRTIRVPPFFKAYRQALRLAMIILRLSSVGRSKNDENSILIPPYWINMPKLFELFVYSKLRLALEGADIEYHSKFLGSIEPDFLVKKVLFEGKGFIADAKYKPKYASSSIEWEDAKQVSGYSRLEDIRKGFPYRKGEHIPCIILYSNQEASSDFDFEDDALEKGKEAHYEDIYRIGIKLPEKEQQKNERHLLS